MGIMIINANSKILTGEQHGLPDQIELHTHCLKGLMIGPNMMTRLGQSICHPLCLGYIVPRTALRWFQGDFLCILRPGLESPPLQKLRGAALLPRRLCPMEPSWLGCSRGRYNKHLSIFIFLVRNYPFVNRDVLAARWSAVFSDIDCLWSIKHGFRLRLCEFFLDQVGCPACHS